MESHPHGNDFVATMARVFPSRTKRLLDVVERAKHAAVTSHRRLVLRGLGCCPQRPSSPLVKSWASSNQSNMLRSASFVNESRPRESRMRTLCAWPIAGKLGHCTLPHDNGQQVKRDMLAEGLERKTCSRSRAFESRGCHGQLHMGDQAMRGSTFRMFQV